MPPPPVVGVVVVVVVVGVVVVVVVVGVVLVVVGVVVVVGAEVVVVGVVIGLGTVPWHCFGTVVANRCKPDSSVDRSSLFTLEGSDLNWFCAFASADPAASQSPAAVA